MTIMKEFEEHTEKEALRSLSSSLCALNKSDLHFLLTCFPLFLKINLACALIMCACSVSGHGVVGASFSCNVKSWPH